MPHGVPEIYTEETWLLGEPLGQIQGLEKPRPHLQRVCKCWLTNKYDGESSALVVAALPHSPIQVGQTPQPAHSTTQLDTGSGPVEPRKRFGLALQNQPGCLGCGLGGAAADIFGIY